MRGTVLWRYTLYVFTLYVLTGVLSTHVGSTDHGPTDPGPTDHPPTDRGPTVRLQPDSDYIYEYEGFTYLKDVAQIKVKAQASTVFDICLHFY